MHSTFSRNQPHNLEIAAPPKPHVQLYAKYFPSSMKFNAGNLRRSPLTINKIKFISTLVYLINCSICIPLPETFDIHPNLGNGKWKYQKNLKPRLDWQTQSSQLQSRNKIKSSNTALGNCYSWAPFCIANCHIVKGKGKKTHIVHCLPSQLSLKGPLNTGFQPSFATSTITLFFPVEKLTSSGLFK